jgi:hypothetical protein
MAHARTQIRARFKSVLEAALPANYQVFSSRKYARNYDPDQVVVDMQISNDQTSAREVMSDDRVHVASLYIRLQRGVADETLLDDALDADEVRVVAAIEGASWRDILEEDPELLQVNFTENADTGVAIGGLVMRYDVEYRIDKTDPETFIE